MTPSRVHIQQDHHEEQSTVEITCSGHDDQTEPPVQAPLATGIYLRRKHAKFLITNWHVVTGRNPATGEMIGTYSPRSLFVKEIVPTQAGSKTVHWFHLYTPEDKPIWIESPRRVTVEGIEQRIDLAIIPIPYNTILEGIQTDVGFTGFSEHPLDQVTVIGFPYKRDRPIWKTAHIAESVQPGPDYFLINGRTKSGMSGSGVFATGSRALEKSTRLMNHQLLGVYSGRIDDRGLYDRLNDLDLGIVWKIDLIESILGSGTV